MISTMPTPAPQLGFDFVVSSDDAADLSDDVLSSGAHEVPAREILFKHAVRDRALNLGMTNWRDLLDRAIALGHTELYCSGPGDQGLRQPGFRFGPITSLPLRGAEYVKQASLARAAKKLGASDEQKSGRVEVVDGLKVECAIRASTIVFGLYSGRKKVAELTLEHNQLPFTDDDVAADLDVQRAYLGPRLASLYAGAPIRELEIAVGTALHQAMKKLWGQQ
ncbi:hypothetical protein [Pseudomonas guariconensis]|uniref:hypothetical protein n=1 Tax=Pseudomonas guariconensis TaxID=1288410 RepID=UPI003905AF26